MGINVPKLGTNVPKTGTTVLEVGKIVLEGEEIDPYVLYDVDGVVMFEIVDGQYRIEKLEGEADVQA